MAGAASPPSTSLSPRVQRRPERWSTASSPSSSTEAADSSAICLQAQEELETHDGVSKAKYTIGLGQDSMAICTEVEDVVSMSLTVVKSLLKNYNIHPKCIGRLEVGSETVIDKSMSIKTWLMQIFEGARTFVQSEKIYHGSIVFNLGMRQRWHKVQIKGG